MLHVATLLAGYVAISSYNEQEACSFHQATYILHPRGRHEVGLIKG